MTYERNILYDNIKTANYCFKTGVTAYNKEPIFKHDMTLKHIDTNGHPNIPKVQNTDGRIPSPHGGTAMNNLSSG